MSTAVTYDPSATHAIYGNDEFTQITDALYAARDEVFADVELLKSGNVIPEDKQPLDAGFIELPHKLLTEYAEQDGQSLVGQILQCAKSLQSNVGRIVCLGIGGSYMGARCLFEALCHPYHNSLPTVLRGSIPQIFFEGHNIDNDSISGLRELLITEPASPGNPETKWGIVVISKSGGTLETAVSFRVFRDALEEFYGCNAPECQTLIVPITGETGKLRNLSNESGYPVSFPIPDGVGGRFSIFTAVGLLPAAIMGIDITALLQGAHYMTERFRDEPASQNPVLDYVATCHVLEKNHGIDVRLLSTWGARLEALGLWYDQLLSESLGKQEQGALPLTVVNTRDLHSRGQQHQEGKRDKMITNVIVKEPQSKPVPMPSVNEKLNLDNLNRLGDKTVPDLLSAAIQGTNQAYADDKRPTTNLYLEKLDAYALGQVLQMFMLATVLEGRLTGINPYGQPGVEAYKKNMNAILDQK